MRGGRPIQKEAGRRHCLLLKVIFLATRTSWEREYKGGVANQLWKYIKEHFNTSLTSTTYPVLRCDRSIIGSNLGAVDEPWPTSSSDSLIAQLERDLVTPPTDQPRAAKASTSVKSYPVRDGGSACTNVPKAGEIGFKRCGTHSLLCRFSC